MRVHFDHRQKLRLLRANDLQVVVSVHFSAAEQAVIDQYGLHHLIVLPRKPIVLHAGGKRREIDTNIYLGRLVRFAHVETVPSPTHAAAFEQDMLEALDQLKAYLQHSFSRPLVRSYDL